MPEVMQVIPKTYDLILWLIPRLKEFPRDQRFLLGDRIQTAALDVLCLLIEANYTRSRAGLLRSANLELEKLRYLVRLAHDLHYLNGRRYQHAAERIDEVGRLVGGWTKADGAGVRPECAARGARPAGEARGGGERARRDDDVKSYRNLWPELTSLENLFLAARRARKGKRSKPACAAFEFRLEGEVLALRRRLMDGSYGFGPYTEFKIRDPKPRRIAAAPYRDRVLHHALPGEEHGSAGARRRSCERRASRRTHRTP